MQTAIFFVFRSSVCIVSVQNITYLYVALNIFVFVKMNALFTFVDICFFMKMKNEVTLLMVLELKKVFFFIFREVISSDACIHTR